MDAVEYVYVVYVMLCFFVIFFHISRLKKDKHEKPIDCELRLLHRG